MTEITRIRGSDKGTCSKLDTEHSLKLCQNMLSNILALIDI